MGQSPHPRSADGAGVEVVVTRFVTFCAARKVMNPDVDTYLKSSYPLQLTPGNR
jgi:hypothetical protein